MSAEVEFWLLLLVLIGLALFKRTKEDKSQDMIRPVIVTISAGSSVIKWV